MTASCKVFSFSRNKVTRLPTYLTKFHKLEVLELERNPIEWPPKFIIEHPRKPETAQSMKDWIRGVQNWIEAETSRPRVHEDSGFSEQQLENNMSASIPHHIIISN